MRTLLIHPVRFNLSDRLVLSSLLRLMQKQLKYSWEISSVPNHADVTLTQMTLENPSTVAQPGTRSSFVRVESRWLTRHGRAEALLFTFPLRAERLLDYLNRAGTEAEKQLQLTASEETRRSPSLAVNTLLSWSAPDLAIEVLRTLAQTQIGSGLRLEVQSGVSLELDFDARGGRWRATDETALLLFGKCVEVGQRLRLRQSDVPAAPAPTFQGPLTSLIWLLAMSVPAPRLFTHLDANAQFSLSSWPDFGALRSQPALIQLAAKMMQAPLTLEQIQSASPLAPERTVAFLNACNAVGLLRQHQARMRSVATPSRNRAPADASSGFDTPPRRLFDRLRVALGIDS